jgi:molybdenum cofactor cytidylyltransferase
MNPTIVSIVLAAGGSSRMGRPKALLRIGADTFVTRVVRTMAEGGAGATIIVTAPGATAIQAAVAACSVPAAFAINPAPEHGQLSSLQVGLDTASAMAADAVLVNLVDCPLVGADTVRRVIDAYRQTGAPIVRPARGGRHGHPVLFAASIFDELRRADLSVGAKAVIRAHAGGVIDVPVDDEGAFVDIDTPEEYERWIRG